MRWVAAWHFSSVLWLMAAWWLSLASSEADSTSLYVCEAGDPAFLGVYVKGSETMDNAPTYTNAQDMSFFRNKGFWYLGNLGPWPPETHYRCVEAEGCNAGVDMPPTNAEGVWSASKRFGKDPVPVVSHTPCADNQGDEL